MCVPGNRRSRSPSLGDGPEYDAGVEIHVAADEPACDVGSLACLDDRVEALARCRWDGYEYCVGLHSPERPADVVETAQNGDALKALTAESGVVVYEPDEPLSLRLAQPSHQAPPAPSRADDQYASLVAAADERGESTRDCSLPETRGPGQQRAKEQVDA